MTRADWRLMIFEPSLTGAGVTQLLVVYLCVYTTATTQRILLMLQRKHTRIRKIGGGSLRQKCVERKELQTWYCICMSCHQKVLTQLLFIDVTFYKGSRLLHLGIYIYGPTFSQLPKTIKWCNPHLTKNQKIKLKRISNKTDAEEKKSLCRILLINAELIKSAVQFTLLWGQWLVIELRYCQCKYTHTHTVYIQVIIKYWL